MTTVYDVWGFGKIVAAGADPNGDYVARVQKAMAAGAADRGISPSEPSDALDASRNIILDEFLGGEWQIDSGTLYVAYDGFPLQTLITEHASPFCT
ncbi:MULTISPECIES: hypothetical protein [Mycolicibacter]|uniref:Uncharacterized protein n=2 Tax=Mycolicibacter TaxID=1073531 RepID=A0ABU5XPN5_9MYCO|nr:MULTISPECIES: hypothetical protein [unclassified Mycolicibacter]MEB3023051.1 hypothetical protein [Mycolicibacter sp. MYC098]MEB3033561.1 hypothetical protein [Mycolicibacter sp. MYC340]